MIGLNEVQYHLEPGIVLFQDKHTEPCEIVCPHSDNHVEFRCESGRYCYEWYFREYSTGITVRNHEFRKYDFELEDWFIVENEVELLIEGEKIPDGI